MQSLETTCDEGDNSVKRYKTSQPQLSQLNNQEQFTAVNAASQEITENPSGKPPIDIFEKLLELHKEECCEKDKKFKEEEENDLENVKYYSLLLEKLVAKERLNTLILNLYPGNKGYSLAFRTLSRSDPNYTEDTANMIETKPWPYEEDDLLRYVDNEELPPFILDLLEPQFSYLFYNGCIIAEVKDYRQAYPHFKCDSHHVLLKPTQRSVMADIHNIMEEKPEWSNEEKEQLESQLLMANSPGLCLDPDHTIGEEVTEVYNRRKMWNTYKFRRMAKKFSQVTVNRKRKLDQFTYRPGLEFYEFLTRTRNKTKSNANSSITSKITGTNIKKDIPVPNLDSPILTPPQEINITEFKPYQRPKETNDCMPQLIEEYILETDMPSKEKGSPRVYHIKLSILQRPSDSEYLGELYLDRDHKKNEQNGVACMFSLGSRMNANRYIHQFTEIFTESGRKSVRISYRLSPGYKERIAQAQAQVQLQNTIQNTNLPQQHLQQLTAAVAMNGTVVNSLNTPNQEAPNVTILGSAKPSTQELAISALATKLMNSAQQFQAESAKKEQQQQQQPQQLSSQHQLQEPPQQQQSRLSGNTAILNLLNSSPASNINTDAVVNAINNSQIIPQLQAVNQKIVSRKMTIPSVANARVLSHNNLITLNSSRLNLQDLGQQTITLASVNTNNLSNLTTVPIKQQVTNQRLIGNNSGDNKSALSALLVGTPAADRPDIIGPNTNSLLLEKLGPNNVQQTHYIQSSKPNQQYMVQPPKGNTTVLNSISSPPPQTSGTINVQGLNIAQLHGIPGIQVQLPGFSQPISLSLNVSSAGNIQAHPASLIVTLPTTTTQTSNSVTQAAVTSNVSGVNSVGINPQTVMLTNSGNSNLGEFTPPLHQYSQLHCLKRVSITKLPSSETEAQLVTSGVKAVTSQGIRTSSPSQTVSIAQSGQSFQLITPLQRSRTQQTTVQQQQQTLTAKSLQRTPITIKMASPSPNQLNDLQLNFDN
ncbi:transcription factor SPT20 homolog isoform X2 [Diorhabda carinulata]|uniref:transcription factor SPT20 homolog isoform X2 n=1 Tax=Diorhabda carinulata TaxID=1163345 RepID=UPI0025A1564A|nr:transcription factor SPT20 homolog isoform X2 [Diorhabda carinulata]